MPFSDPDRRRSYQRDYRRMRRAGEGGTTPVHPAIPAEVRVKTAADVLDLLQEQINAVRSTNEAGTLEKARTVGYLAGIALKAVEVVNVAARLEAIELVLKQRPEVHQ